MGAYALPFFCISKFPTGASTHGEKRFEKQTVDQFDISDLY